MSTADRRQRWGAVLALAVIAATFSNPFSASLLFFIPLGALLLALPPRSPASIVLALVLVAVAFVAPVRDSLWYAERGIALLLAAWFVLFTALRPERSFLPNGLAALGCSVVSAFVMSLAFGGVQQFDWVVSSRVRDSATQMASLLGANQSESGREFANAMYQSVDLQVMLYPSLMAIGALCALAIAWWSFRRITERAVIHFSPLREFRFSDELIWLFIAGVALIALPSLLGRATDVTVRAGTNLLVFMGALYALRGVAVLVALFGAPSFAGALFGTIAALMLYPVIVIVGVTDTWMDLRARKRAASE